MQRHNVTVIVGCVLLIPVTLLLCGGRNLLAERVAELEILVAAQQAELERQPVVVDSTGAVVAWFEATQGNDEGGIIGHGNAVLDVEGHPLLPVHFKRDNIIGTIQSVGFGTLDCTGPPLFNAGGDYLAPVLPQTLVVNQAKTVFYADVDAPVQSLASRSTMHWRGTCYSNPSPNPNPEPRVTGFRAALPGFSPPYEVVTRADLLETP